MIKQIALAAAVAATTSFATYNFFPVGEAGKGAVEVKNVYSWHDDWSQDRINLQAKYNVAQNFELSIQSVGYQLWSEDDNCDNCPDHDGIYAMTVGARYQFMPMLIGALDIQLPLNSDDVVGFYDPFGLYAAIQYTQFFIPELLFGSELGFDWKFEDNDFEQGLRLQILAELDYITSFGLVPWIGFGYFNQLTEDELDGNEVGGDDSQIQVWIGASYAIVPAVSLKAQFTLSKGDLWGDSNALMIGAEVNF